MLNVDDIDRLIVLVARKMAIGAAPPHIRDALINIGLTAAETELIMAAALILWGG